MRAYRNHAIWFISFLLLIVTAGCSDRDDRAGNPTLSSPGVASVTPPDGNVICSSRNQPGQCHLQQGDEPGHHQQFYVYGDRPRGSDRRWHGQLRRGDQHGDVHAHP